MVVKADNVTLSFPKDKNPVFQDVSLHLDEGETALVTGPEGSGKTLFGLTLAGFLPLWTAYWELKGVIELFGEPLVQGEYRKDVGLVLENPSMQLSSMKRTVVEELAFPLECRGVEHTGIRETIVDYAGRFGVRRLLNQPLKHLSGGELQRIIIACALMACPRFLFLDRFMAEIDGDFRDELLGIIESHVIENRGAAVLAEDPWLLPGRTFHTEVSLGEPEEAPLISGTSGDEHDAEKVEIALTPGDELLDIQSINFSYGDGTEIFRDFSMAVREGELVFLTGPNGAGKTTLAKLITGIIGLKSGEILLKGCSLRKFERHEIVSHVGFALQNPNLQLARKTVGEELALAERWGHSAGEIVEILGLHEALNVHPCDLTQGGKKRLSIALAASTKRKLIILDEPSQYQDGRGFARVVKSLNHMRRESKGIIVITHDPRFFQAYPRARIIHLSREGIY